MYVSESTRIISTLLACTGIFTLVITLLIVYVIRTCTKRRSHHQDTSTSNKKHREHPATAGFNCNINDDGDSIGSESSDRLPEEVDDQLAREEAGDVIGPLVITGLRQAIRSFTGLWHKGRRQNLSGASYPNSNNASAASFSNLDLDFVRLSAPMFAKRSTPLQPVLVRTQ